MDNEDTLNKLHSVLLEILTEFDRICSKHNIPYFLDSGTALGAIRHGGFIPWDDDLDVGMLQEDYDRFVKIVSTEIKNDYYFQSREVDSTYNKFHAKLRKRNTYYPEKGAETLAHKGIFIDIFPFSFVSDNGFFRRIEQFVNLRFRHLLLFRLYPEQRTTFAKKILVPLTYIVPLSVLERGYSAFQHLHKGTNTLVSYHYKKENTYKIFDYSLFKSFKSISFNGKDFLIMEGYDEYLRIMYGDYMKLPPDGAKVCHLDGRISFNSEE